MAETDTSTRTSTMPRGVRWAVVLGAAAMHPALLFWLFPLVGERANLVVILAPVLAAGLFRFSVGIVFALINIVVTAIVFTLLAGPGGPEGPRKALFVLLVTSAICFGVDRLKRLREDRPYEGRDRQAERPGRDGTLTAGGPPWQ